MHRKFIRLIFGMAVLTPGLGLAAQAADGAPLASHRGDDDGSSRDETKSQMPNHLTSQTYIPHLHGPFPTPKSPPPSNAVSASCSRTRMPMAPGVRRAHQRAEIIAGIGSHHAFRTAVTALCVSALIEVSGPSNKLLDPDAVRCAIESGEELLVPRAAAGPP